MCIITIRILYQIIRILRKNKKKGEGMQIHTEKNQKEIKSHGSFAFPVHISPESIQSYEQGNFLWHWHPEIELTLITSGQMEYYVNDKKYTLSEGEGLFGNSNTLHSGHMKDGQNCDYLTVTFHPRFIYGYENSLLQTRYVDFITSSEVWHSLKLTPDTKWQQEILVLIQEVTMLAKDPPYDYELEVHLLLTQIWQKLYRYFKSLPEEEARPQKHLERLKQILTYLQTHYQEDLSLDDVADHISICKSECCRFFKKYMKMTIFDYLLFLRIQNSLPLLRAGESITKTAGMVGFSTPAYYGQIFKRYMGCSPTAWRSMSSH